MQSPFYQSSPPAPTPTRPQGSRLKRRRSPSPSANRGDRNNGANTRGSRSTGNAGRSSSPGGANTSLPPSSPQRFSDTDDNSGVSDIDAVLDVDEIEGKPIDEDDEDAEGEDLFAEGMEE